MERLGYSAKEVADKLGLDTKTVYRAIAMGQIPVLRVGNRQIITAPVFNRMLEEGKNQP
jgi:excisionase family DNA binding protein